MAFSDAVEWWEDWQLRILVLSSLFIQLFLSTSAPLRKFRIPPWFRFFIWLAYLGSDAMAIYALATMFNRHKKQEWVSKQTNSPALEALWAPILLVHLGGRDSITAYNIEDNELWRRHVLTALSQIAVAIYVFYKSWSGDRNLLLAKIFIFVWGIKKCVEKPWALKSASINDLMTSSKSNKDEGASDDIDSFKKYVQAAMESFWTDKNSQPIPEQGPSRALQLHGDGRMERKAGNDYIVQDKVYKLFIDHACPFSERLNNLKYMAHNSNEAHRLVKSGLSKAFDRLYTKDEIFLGNILLRECSPRKFWLIMLPRDITGCLAVTAIVLFHKTNKEAYNDTDVKVTYILLYLTILMALGTVAKAFGRGIELGGWTLWSDQICQYNLIGYLARNKKHSWVRKVATLLVCKDNLDQLWCMKPCKSSWDITAAVHKRVKVAWEDDIENVVIYRDFHDIRGQWTLMDFDCSDLEWSLKRPFDESVLIWHLATDFCFYQTNTSPKEHLYKEAASRCRTISNYMTYLLFVNPEMLMAGARGTLFKSVYRELKDLLKKDQDPSSLHEIELTLKVINLLQESREQEEAPGGTSRKSIARSAWELAEALAGMGDEKKTWRVIEGVWLEMLCFSALRCRGYLHAKSLGTGGEYLSNVWMLLSYMGMATSAEILQIAVLQYGSGTSTLAPTNTAGENNA